MLLPNFRKSAEYVNLNPFLRTYVVAEMLIWSSLNFVTPIFALYVATLPSGNIEVAAAAVTVFLVVRVVAELLSGVYSAKASEHKKIIITLFSVGLISLGYLGFSFANSIDLIYLSYGLIGAGLGFATPAKNTLFSSHLDRNKETVEWGLMDASVLIFMALTATLGGYIATNYGFVTLFYTAAVVNILGVIPFLIYLKIRGK